MLRNLNLIRCMRIWSCYLLLTAMSMLKDKLPSDWLGDTLWYVICNLKPLPWSLWLLIPSLVGQCLCAPSALKEFIGPMVRRIHFSDGQDVHLLNVVGKFLREYFKSVSINSSVCLLTTSSQVLVFPYSSDMRRSDGIRIILLRVPSWKVSRTTATALLIFCSVIASAEKNVLPLI